MNSNGAKRIVVDNEFVYFIKGGGGGSVCLSPNAILFFFFTKTHNSHNKPNLALLFVSSVPIR